LQAVDVHQHLWPEALVRALEERAGRPRLRGSRLELVEEGDFEVDLRSHDLDRRLALLDRDGIDVAVVSCPPTLGLPPDLLDAYHEGVVEAVRAAGGRLVALATDAVIDSFAGTCVAATTLARLDRATPLLDALSAAGGFLFVHPGPAPPPAGAPAWWPPVVGYTAQMQAAYFAWLAGGATRWPGLRVLFAILGGGAPFQLERLAARGGGAAPRAENVYLDTASYGRAALALSAEALGPAALVYGSDAPVIDPGPTLAAVRELGLEQAACRANPAALLA